MPYSSNKELPEAVQKLPKHAQDIFRNAFNNALKEYDDNEETAFKVAWAAVKNKYEKKDDEWVSKENEAEKGNMREVLILPISFSEIEKMEREEKRSTEMKEITDLFCEMVTNIISREDIEDKVGKVNDLVGEYTEKLTELQEIQQRRQLKEDEEDVELAESAFLTEIQEADVGPLHAVVRIIRPGWGNKTHNHYYPKDVLRRDAHKFIGAKMYETDHRPQEKSTRTWVSTIEDIVGFDGGAPLAKVAVHDQGFGERLKNLDKLGILDKMECSIYANGLAKKGFKLDGREGKQVESITDVSSVDWVTKAGAGGAAVSLVENVPDDKEISMDKEKEVIEEQVEETVEEVEIQETEPEVQETEEQPDKLLEVDVIRDLLAETDLPKYAQTRLAYSGRFTSEEEVKEAAEAEIEYIKRVTHSGKPFGMSKKTPEKKVDKFAEAEEQKNETVRKFLGIKK
jgi:cation transport regulator